MSSDELQRLFAMAIDEGWTRGESGYRSCNVLSALSGWLKRDHPDIAEQLRAIVADDLADIHSGSATRSAPIREQRTEAQERTALTTHTTDQGGARHGL